MSSTRNITKEHARAGAIGRVSWQDGFYDGLLFIVLDRDIGHANGFLRAALLHYERRRDDHGDPLAAAFAMVMSRVASWTPEMYAAFSRAIADYLKKGKLWGNGRGLR
jgi:uncharacterized membrane protein